MRVLGALFSTRALNQRGQKNRLHFTLVARTRPHVTSNLVELHCLKYRPTKRWWDKFGFLMSSTCSYTPGPQQEVHPEDLHEISKRIYSRVQNLHWAEGRVTVHVRHKIQIGFPSLRLKFPTKQADLGKRELIRRKRPSTHRTQDPQPRICWLGWILCYPAHTTSVWRHFPWCYRHLKLTKKTPLCRQGSRQTFILVGRGITQHKYNTTMQRYCNDLMRHRSAQNKRTGTQLGDKTQKW